MKELGKVQNGIKSGAGRNDIYISKQAQFNSVAFPRDMVTPRKTVTSVIRLSFVSHSHLRNFLSRGQEGGGWVVYMVT